MVSVGVEVSVGVTGVGVSVGGSVLVAVLYTGNVGKGVGAFGFALVGGFCWAVVAKLT